MTTMLYPPEWETIINNEPITAEEFLELYRPAREFCEEYILVAHTTHMSADSIYGYEILQYALDEVIPYEHGALGLYQGQANPYEDWRTKGCIRTSIPQYRPFWQWKKIYEWLLMFCQHGCSERDYITEIAPDPADYGYTSA